MQNVGLNELIKQKEKHHVTLLPLKVTQKHNLLINANTAALNRITEKNASMRLDHTDFQTGHI